MREILFRGKCTTNGEWVYGSLIQSKNSTSIWSEELKDDVEVDPGTVGQWTGFRDKHNKRIFEGDICRAYLQDLDCNDGREYEEGIFVVKWEKDNAMFVLSNDSQDLEFGYLSSCEVIGNIHDNPKLLRGELT